MTINKNSVEQINVALLDMDKKIKSVNNASDLKNLEASVDSIKRTLNETTAGLEPGKTYNINISGNAATAYKVVNALTVNGKTYDGSTAVDAGVQTVENGGTGATTAHGAFINLANGLLEGVGPEDAEHIIFKNASGKDWGLYTLSQFWEYIKGKISSVLGLTKDNYGGKASTAGTADVANAIANRGGITNTDTFQNVMNNDGKWRITDLNQDWNGSFYSFYTGGSQSGLMFRIRGGSTDIRNIEVNYSIDSSQFAGPWTPLIGRIPTSAPSSPNDGDIWIE